MFLVEIMFNTLGAKCMSFAKRHVTQNVIHTIKSYIETKQLDIQVQTEQLVICIVLFLISAVIVFVLKRVTYVKVCSSLGMNYLLLKVGTFILPEIGLLLTYICFYRKNKVAEIE